MTIKSGSAWAGSFVTLDATGALAAGSPSGVLYVDGAANGATVTITGSNPYKWAVTLPALTAGQRVDMYITATISTIATAGFVASEQADTALTSEVKTETAAILADTGTDGVVLKAAGLNADAVTKIQSGLALEATLTAIKGAGWSTETLEFIGGKSTNIVQLLTEDGVIVHPSMGFATTTHLQEVEDKVDSILEDTGTTLDTLIKDIPTNAEITTALGTADDAVLAAVAAAKTVIDNIHDTDLPAVKTETAAIKAKTDNLPATPASAGEYTAAIAAIPTTPLLAADYTAPDNASIAAIKAKTDNLPADPADDSDIDATLTTIINYLTDEKDLLTNMGGTVWANPTRTLTNSTSGATVPAQGETLEIYKDSTVTINFTGLGDVSGLSSDTNGQEDKVWFTAKKSLDDLDASSIIQIHVLYPAGSNPPDTLDYIEGAEATADEGTFQFTDTTTGAATLTLTAAATADLSIYVASPLYWDIKSLDYSTGIVNILASGQMYIYGTPTKSIS